MQPASLPGQPGSSTVVTLPHEPLVEAEQVALWIFEVKFIRIAGAHNQLLGSVMVRLYLPAERRIERVQQLNNRNS
jgi:hypothetical protein